MEAIGVIPARIGSTRLPKKVLMDLCGKPVIQHVYEATRKARLLDEVIVACDDEEILSVVRGFGGKAVLTSKDHTTGTDRLAEVVNELDVSIVVNIQGDEPLVSPLTIDDLVALMQKEPETVMATVVKQSNDPAEFASPDVVKAVLDCEDHVLYFSRSPIPTQLPRGGKYFKHIGLYAFTKEFLFTFKKMPPSDLERYERLEQLRALENGYRIKAIETNLETVGIDTAEDLEKARALLQKGSPASSAAAEKGSV
ncbi:MAG: 3-deoxy-manno-octulosonate cytidylyltransferase [Candidatus Omnitrophica bacterium]|nr:3-deoxy-manno-octulosonate cytidylyltransferase [Candidatus Omnitrophota bacterium]